MEMMFTIQIDCEATQRSFQDPALGERSVRGFAEVCAETGIKATFAVVPGDLQASGHVYRDLETQGHEISLHLHPAELGYQEFLGVYGSEEQTQILREAADIFAEVMGRAPKAFTPGYASANDHTFPVLESLGFRHGCVSIPTRNLPQCACIWGNSPLDIHYPHRYNRSLVGDVDFVEIPSTVDPESRMWGGAHPQDLRIELVDAKNHWYTIHKSVRRQLAAAGAIPVKYLKATTHNVFDYSDPRDFRRETLYGVIAAARQICEQEECDFVPATLEEIAAWYRVCVPRPESGPTLELDTRGRAAWKAKV
jgi:hypothetical protein